jgi:hypothetical protein
MLVRVVRRVERGLWIGAIGCATAAAAALVPQVLGAQESPVPKTHTVKRGDTLWDLAKTYLGDSFLWPDIYRVNVDVIEDPHWIYPGEVLKVPGETATVIAVAPPAAAPQSPVPAPMPTAPAEARPAETTPAALAPAQVETTITATPALMQAEFAVRSSEYAASPWVEGRGGPKGSGYIVQNGEVSAVASADHSRMNLYDPIMIAPPAGTASAGQLFLSYRLGPLIENLGQIVIPTGIIRVARANRAGDAAVAHVVRMFGEVLQGQRLIPYDSSGALVAGRPGPVANGASGKVRWLYEKPVLPSIQSYVVLDISSRNGVRTGDEVEFYQPRQAPVDGRDIAIPEIYIAKAQVLRVTPYGVTAIITGQAQTRIEEGTAARVAAKMP